MVLRIFEIELDNSAKLYAAGQTVVGKVIIEVDQVEKKFQEIGLRLWGKAEVGWANSKKKDKKQTRATSATPEIRVSLSRDNVTTAAASGDKFFSCEESYFDRRYTILEKEGKEDLSIKPGKNSYPFEISLPSGIPSSFEGEYGSVKYFLEAVIKRPAGQYDHTCNCQLYVKGILDLNSDPQAQINKPEINHEEYLCCLCFKNGPVGFNFGILGNAGMLAGEETEFLADIYNMSESREVSIKLKLNQVTTYHVQHENKVVRKQLLKLKGPSVRRGGTGTWGESFKVPEGIAPTRLAGRSSLISMEYYLEIIVETNRGKKISAQLPIIIGTVPYGVKVDDFIASFNTPSYGTTSDF